MIAIVDVCSGNLRSVERAVAAVGGEVVVTRDAEVIRRADKLIVPGQGAFGVFMQSLDARGLRGALVEAITSGRPYLGICLGLQILFDESAEQGPCRGLGVVAGRVLRLAPPDPRLKVPHIGWNQIERPSGAAVDPLLVGIPDPAYVYFVHSYHAVPADPSVVVLETHHGQSITAAIRIGNVFACQFHPEKSQALGLTILRNFVEAA